MTMEINTATQKRLDCKNYKGSSDKAPKTYDVSVDFYINHFFPDVNLVKAGNKTLTVSISGRRSGGDKQNNYKVQLKQGSGKDSHYDEGRCVVVPQSGASNPDKATFDNLKAGTYELRVRDQVNEGVQWYGNSNCSGSDWAFYSYKVDVTDNDIVISDKTIDPDHIDVNSLNPGATPTPPGPPCTKYISKANDGTNGGCGSFISAIGTLNTDAPGLIRRFFEIMLSLAGGLLLIIIITTGYRLMVSQGNPEAIKGVREQMTSAIVGFLFLIFSLVILEIIGVDILHLQGFVR